MIKKWLRKIFSITKDYLPKQNELYMQCPMCMEWVKIDHLPDGRSFPQAIVDENLTEIKNIVFGHKECGFQIKFTIARKIAVHLIEDKIMEDYYDQL